MRAGTLVQVGSPQALYHHPRDADTARFLGDCIVLDAELRQGQARCALGTIPVADTQREGSAHIMLRPEQLELGPQDGAGVRAEVVDTDFGGASCTVRVQLAERNVAPMEVRSPSLALPAVGSMVSVQVRGEAHVFA
jgi:iron(III) transport system ATP-binding protein